MATIASTILDQLGGTRRLSVMTGARNFVDHGDAVSFRVGRNANGVNYVKVTLTPQDVYDVEFRYVTVNRNVLKSAVNEVYVDTLVPVVEAGTGMYLSL